MTTTPDAAAIPRRYRIGLLGLDLLSAASASDALAVSALAVRAHREGGLPAPLTATRLPQHLADARAWLELEAEEGRDLAPADVAAAFEAIRTGAAPSAPVADIVPQQPSQS